MRDLLLYHLANALSWFTISDALENEVAECARKFTPSLSHQEALSYCSSVINRAKKTQIEGKEHRYRYRRETIYRELEDLIPEEVLPRLRAIIPSELARERKLERTLESRREKGIAERVIYRESLQTNKSKAIKLKAQGLKYKEIALELNLSIDTIKGYFRKGVLV